MAYLDFFVLVVPALAFAFVFGLTVDFAFTVVVALAVLVAFVVAFDLVAVTLLVREVFVLETEVALRDLVEGVLLVVAERFGRGLALDSLLVLSIWFSIWFKRVRSASTNSC